MSDPTRLRDESSGLARAILGAAEEPSPPDLHSKIRAAVLAGGAAVAGTGVAGMGTAGMGTAGSVGAATTAKTSSLVASLTVGKWLGIVAIGAVVSVGADRFVHSVSPAPAALRTLPAQPLVEPRIASAPPQARGVAAAPAPALASESPSPAAVPAVPRLARGVSSVASSASLTPDVTTEVTSLDSARKALAAGDLDGAIERLNRHDLEFPRGELRPEALAVRLETYAAKHDSVRVRDLAARFLAAYPGHPFAVRAQAMLEAESR